MCPVAIRKMSQHQDSCTTDTFIVDVLISVDKPQRATGAVLMTQGSVDKFAAITTFHIPHVSTLESYLPHKSKTIEVLLKLNLKLSCSCE